MNAAEKRRIECEARVCARCAHYWSDMDPDAPEHLCTRQRRDSVDVVVGLVRSGPFLACVEERAQDGECGLGGLKFVAAPEGARWVPERNDA